MRDFNDPFEMLRASHHRLSEELVRLELAARPAVDDQRQAADIVGEVLGYLRRSVVRHERDEEESLFPRLTSADLSDEMRSAIVQLQREHVLQRELTERLEEQLKAGDALGVEETSAQLCASYRAHIALEEQTVFPGAASVLTIHQQKEMLIEMGGRRGEGATSNGRGGGRGGGGGGGGGGRR